MTIRFESLARSAVSLAAAVGFTLLMIGHTVSLGPVA